MLKNNEASKELRKQQKKLDKAREATQNFISSLLAKDRERDLKRQVA